MSAENAKKLGFGLMRLPRKGINIDVEQMKDMVDRFMEDGFTYFDTAFIYPGSEAAASKALISRYPRESYTLATKLNVMVAPTAKLAHKQFETSLKRTGAKYFDYYLLHALMKNNYRKYEKLGLWDFVKEKKEQGLIKHVGFSFHDSPELLDEILTDHPEVDFVQLQINYLDWEDPKIASRRNYEVARKHGKQIVIMEPVKGGQLAKVSQDVEKLFKDVNPDLSVASWAIRFAAGLDGVMMVLSGMSNMEQMEDNLSYMKDFQPLNEKELQILNQAREIMGQSKAIGCTGCSYCTKGCPKEIAIPDYFKAMNARLVNGQIEESIRLYEQAAQKGGLPKDCIHCSQCEQACPQQLPVMELLESCQSLANA